MKKKKIIVLISILSIVLICLIIMLTILLNKKRAEENQNQQIVAKEEFLKKATEHYFEDKICPQGMATLYANYHGSNDLNDLYSGLYNFVHYSSEAYNEVKDYDKAKVEEFYQSNTRKIRNNMGLRSFEEFYEYIEYLKEIEFTDDSNYQYCKIDTNTYEEDDYYLMFNISFYYEKMEQPINAKVYFSNSNYMKYDVPKIKFEIIQ